MKNFWTTWTHQSGRVTDRITDRAWLADAFVPFLMLCAVTLISFLTVDIFYRIVVINASLTERTTIRLHSNRSVGSINKSVGQFAIISQRNLFATTLTPIEDKKTVVRMPTEEYTDFNLKGTIAVNATIGYAIVEEKGKGKQKIYRIGEMIGSAKLIRVTRNTAVLKSGGRELVMKIKETTSGLQAVRSRPQRGRNIAVSREEVTQSLSNLTSIMSQALVRPYVVNGAQEGFVVSNIAPGSLYSRLGLKNGDVVVDVNDKKLETADDVLQLVGVMQAGGAISVKLLRNGQKETINYSFR